jgi:hypothetical protein
VEGIWALVEKGGRVRLRRDQVMDLRLVSEVLVPMKLAFREVVGGVGSGQSLRHCPKVAIDLFKMFLTQVGTHVATLHRGVARLMIRGG